MDRTSAGEHGTSGNRLGDGGYLLWDVCGVLYGNDKTAKPHPDPPHRGREMKYGEEARRKEKGENRKKKAILLAYVKKK